ncbi:hypothetical protein ACUV84_033085 [Puccinellia chinampoensis]
MGLTATEREHHDDQWQVVPVLLLLYAAFFLAALVVALVFLLDPSTCRGAARVHCPRLLSLYASWAACALLFAPVLRYVRGALLPPLTPAAAALAFKRVGCPLYLFVVLTDYLAVTATELGSRYAVACTGAAGAATVSFVGVLVSCVWLGSGGQEECRDVDVQFVDLEISKG